MAMTPNGYRLLIRLNKILPSVYSVSRYSTDPNILKSPYPDVDIPKISVPDYLFSRFDKWTNHIAFECGITGRKYTFDQLRTNVRNLAAALRKKLKLQKGDVVAVMMTNSPEFPIAALGIVQAGLIVTTVNPIYTPDEICRQLNDSDVKAMITFSDMFSLAKKASELAKRNISILTIPSKEGESTPTGAINFKEFVESKADSLDIPECNPEDVAFLPYSSGTTGLPKGVQLTHTNIIANLCQLYIPELEFCVETTPDHQDVVPVVLPQYHIYGLTVNTFHTLSKGCKSVTLPRFTPESFIKTLINHKPHVLFLVPPLVMFLSSHDAVKSEHLSSIRGIVSGAAPLGASDEVRLIEKAKNNLILRQGLGLTETSPSITLLSPLADSKINQGSVGPPIPLTFLKIVDTANPNGPALGPNSTGELLVKGPQVMKGYLNRPEDNDNTFVDGWLRTGDVVHYNENRLIFVTDRVKELIKVKGHQVPPAELEQVIRQFPGIVEVGVIGIPHEKFGEVPRAYVVQKEGTKIDIKKLVEYVTERVTPYKRLVGGVSIIDKIPKTPTGKILRKNLKLLYEEKNI